MLDCWCRIRTISHRLSETDLFQLLCFLGQDILDLLLFFSQFTEFLFLLFLAYLRVCRTCEKKKHLKSQKSFHHLSSDTTWLLDLHRIIFSVLSLTKMWFYFQLGQIRKLTRRYQTPVTGCYTIILHGSVSQSGHFRSSVLCEIHSQFLQTPCWP